MSSGKVFSSVLVFSTLFVGSAGFAGILVNPLGLVEELVADPVRNVFYASLETDEIVVVDASTASIADRETVADNPRMLAVSRDGSKLYVSLTATQNVAEYDLPGLTFNRTFTLSGTGNSAPGMAAQAGRLYVARGNGLSVVDTSTGGEISFFQLNAVLWSNVAILRLSPDGNTLYSMDVGLSPASIYVFDVSEDTPRYIGEDCCHGCLGGNGQAMELSPDGSRAYVTVGGTYRLQVLSTVALLHPEFTGLTGPFPNSVAPSQDGSHVYVGYSGPEFAAVRTSDWLPYHEGDLQGDVVRRGLALAFDQQTLAAVIEFTNFDPDRIELLDVTSLPANRGGIRMRALDDLELVPILGARIQDPVFEGDSDYFDVAGGVLGRAPMELGPFDTDISAPGHATINMTGTVSGGVWTDLGDVVMTRTGDMPDPDEVCASPAAVIGETATVNVTGRGFFDGEGLLVESLDSDFTIESFEFESWANITASVSVPADAEPGLGFFDLKVTNPDGGFDTGSILKLPQSPMIFEDGFESGDTSAWSSAVP